MKPFLPLATVLIGLGWFMPGAKAADLAGHRPARIRTLPPAARRDPVRT